MIDILLATCNGERFLTEQLESILSQSCHDFRILAGDDSSQDYTLEILKSYEREYGDIMSVTVSATHSAKENFYNLMELAQSDYICLCDQDDVWESDKLEKGLNAIQSFERKYGCNTPVLIHSDLCIVDENLTAVGRRMRDINGLKGRRLSTAIKVAVMENLYEFDTGGRLSRLLAENNITGNTVIFNRALLRLYKRPETSFMHDWWLGILAYTFGRVGYIDEPLVKYRQHGSNTLGAAGPFDCENLKKRVRAADKVRQNYDSMFAQAGEFLRLYRSEADGLSAGNTDAKTAYDIIAAFFSMKDKSRLAKMVDICKYKFFKSSPMLTIGEMLNI